MTAVIGLALAAVIELTMVAATGLASAEPACSAELEADSTLWARTIHK